MSAVAGRQPASPPSDHECVRAWSALRAVYELVSESLTEALARECGLTINEYDALLSLYEAAPRRVRLGDLVAAASLSQPALSRLVTRLEHQGLVSRCEDGGDRRGVLVDLTDAGRAVLARAIPVHAACVSRLLTAKMTDQEQRALISLFDRIQTAVDE